MLIIFMDSDCMHGVAQAPSLRLKLEQEDSALGEGSEQKVQRRDDDPRDWTQ